MAVKFPIVVWATGKEKIPDSPFVIIMAKNGTFLLKRAGIVEAAVPYNEPVSGLATYAPWAELNVEKIPFEIFMQVFHFFREIYKSKRSECNAILFYNPKEKLWSPVVPPQVVTHSSVHYKDGMAGAQDGWVKVGTFHSHCDFSAGHSGGDHRDEEHFDGIHMTIGHVDSNPTLSVSLVVNGNRFMKAPQEYIAGVRRVEETIEVQEYETKWVDDDEPDEKDNDSDKEGGSLISGMTEFVTRWLPRFGGGEVSGASTTYTPHRKTSARFYKPQKQIKVPTGVVERTITKLVFDFPEGQDVEDYPFPEEWLEYVKTADEVRRESTPAPVPMRRKRKFRHKADVTQPPKDSHPADAETSATDSGEPGDSRTDEEGTAFTNLTEDELAAIIARHERGCQEGEEWE